MIFTGYSIFLPYFSFHANFQLFEKFEHAQTFQLIEVNFLFVENVKIFVIAFHNLLISRKQIHLNG